MILMLCTAKESPLCHDQWTDQWTDVQVNGSVVPSSKSVYRTSQTRKFGQARRIYIYEEMYDLLSTHDQLSFKYQ